MLKSGIRRLLLAGFSAALMVAGAKADPVADFYADHNVNVVIGYSVGGGYDLYARLLSRFFADNMAGKPVVVPQNMPGAGSLKAVLYLNAIAPKDGTVFGTFGRSLVLEPLFSGAKFDPRKFSWLGSITADSSLCVTWAGSPIKTWDDLMTKSARMGGQAAGSDPDVYANILKTLFGSNLRLVTGYPGNNEMALALERGELDGFCGLSWSSLQARHRDWITGHKINIITKASAGGDDGIAAPQMMDKLMDPKKRAALHLILATQAMARPYSAPPGVAPERLAALRAAFLKTVNSPEFRAEADKLGLDVNPVPAEAVEKNLEEIYSQPADVIALAKQAVGQ
jgi:tripartite-type tricarboxylate transporter receptor subunit TctC